MPVAETGYEQRVGPGNSAPLPTASAAAFGGQIGAAVSELGDTMHAAQLRAYQVERKATQDRELAEGTARLVKWQAETERAIVDRRTNAAAGAAGHVAAVETMFTPETKEALFAGVTEDNVRQSLSRQFDAHAASSSTREYDWAAGVSSAKVATDTQETIETLGNTTRTSDDPKAFENGLATSATLIHGLTNVDEATRAKLSKYAGETQAAAYLNRMFDKGQPQAALTLIDSGAMNSYLSPQQIDQLRNEGRAEVRRLDLQKSAQASHAKADAVEKIQRFNAEVDAGVEKTPTEIRQIASLATAIGDDSAAVTVTALGIRAGVAKEFRNAPASAMQGEISRLQALPKRSGEDDIRLKALQTQMPARLSLERENPLAIRAANGSPVTPLDPGQPASYQRRAEEARSTAATLGGPVRPYMGDAELAPLRDKLLGSPKDRLAVAEDISRFGDAATMKAAARQVAPRDQAFQRAIALGTLGFPDFMRAALNGPDALAAAPNVWNEVDAREAWSDMTGAALREMPADWVSGVGATAKNIYASEMRAQGLTTWNESNYRIAIQHALGRFNASGKGSVGGLAEYHAGEMVALPDRVPLDQFQKRLYRATPADFLRAAGGQHPQWPDGSTITVEQFRRLKPVMVGDGRYAFEIRPNRYLPTKTGIYSIDFNKLPSR